jgi:hypothetical protein
LQFKQPNQIIFTSLHAYQTLGAACKPYLTLTHYTDLRDSKGIVLMRGEVDDEVLGNQMKLNEARMLALYMQAYYVEVSWFAEFSPVSSPLTRFSRPATAQRTETRASARFP